MRLLLVRVTRILDKSTAISTSSGRQNKTTQKGDVGYKSAAQMTQENFRHKTKGFFFKLLGVMLYFKTGNALLIGHGVIHQYFNETIRSTMSTHKGKAYQRNCP